MDHGIPERYTRTSIMDVLPIGLPGGRLGLYWRGRSWRGRWRVKLGSLFDGSGGFPLAGTMCGITPAWASEIEAYPIRVTSARFPSMRHLGDITKLVGSEIEPVDVITFGSPCQDLSAAGKRAGIYEGARSSLFFHAIRIIREMREATNGLYPRIIVWENVHGAYSSNGGEDFRAVLQALCEIADPDANVPRPEKGKWRKAGCIVGDGYSVAWRTYDAQYWGVPQRRRRIYLVADFRGERAGEVFFEPESVRWDPAQGNQERETASVHDAGGDCGGAAVNRAAGFDDSLGERAKGRMGYAEGLSPTLRAGDARAVVYSVQGNTVDRDAKQNGNGLSESIAHTLNTTDRHAVVYDARGNGTVGVAPTVTGNHNGRVSDYSAVVCAGNGQLNQISMAEQSNTLDCMHDQQMILAKTGEPKRKYIIRRLTPLECCRLQGFPDWWEDGVQGSDSARYKMWGNGIAFPCAYDVMSRVKRLLEEE